MRIRTGEPDDATLEIGIDQPIGGQLVLGYVAQVRDVTEGRAPDERASRSGLVLPVGGDAKLTLPVRHGRYLVEAYSPSGATLDAEVQVEAGATASVRLQGDRADRDWLAWQSLSGNLERAQSFAAPYPAPKASAVAAVRWLWRALSGLGTLGVAYLIFVVFQGVRAFWGHGSPTLVDSQRLVASHPSAALAKLSSAASLDQAPPWAIWALTAAVVGWLLYRLLLSEERMVFGLKARRAEPPPAAPSQASPATSSIAALGRSPEPLDVVLLRTPHGRTEWDAIMNARGDARAFIAPFEGEPTPLAPCAHDGTWRTFQIDLEEPYGGPAAWVLDTTEGARGGLAKLPAPWRDPGENFAAVEILAPVASQAAGRISAAVRDPAFATLLGYLAGGRLTEAQAIVENAIDALFGKGENPYAAAAGGYVLVATQTDFSDRDADWRQWLANLDARFPWLPDGAVLHAVSLIQTGQDGAREKLIEAFERGVPVYTEGLRRLRDGLTFVLDDDADGRAKAAYDIVNEIAGRCDAQQAFTCLRLGR